MRNRPAPNGNTGSASVTVSCAEEAAEYSEREKKAIKFYSFKAECEKHSLQGNNTGGGVLGAMEKVCKGTYQKNGTLTVSP